MKENKDIVIIHCYNETKQMERQRALKKYLECMMCSEGSENERYARIYCSLMSGDKEVWDT